MALSHFTYVYNSFSINIYIIIYKINYNIFEYTSNYQQVWRLTLQVTDVLRLRRRALRSKDQQPQNVLEQNTTKARSADWCFVEAKPPKGGKAVTFVRRSTPISILFFQNQYIYNNYFLYIF